MEKKEKGDKKTPEKSEEGEKRRSWVGAGEFTLLSNDKSCR